ncbi:MAG: VIT domain-containing protein [Candidatus Bipolaricaulis sp.]|nr:VIT domain-containing protein [Candidatus Bipolaricaulis sp.]MDD5645992.1 VIT domain-containing protein [Candidatus Bipolaricaulis sp.]
MIAYRGRLVSLVVLVAIAALSAAAFADGFILPDPPNAGRLDVIYHDVTIDVHDGVVTTRVDQAFRNDTGRTLEGRYVFPVPPDAVVSGFLMWVDGEALEAQVLDADEARAIYEDYVRRAIDPALLEYVGRSALSARIYPIRPGEERRIQITYSELLSADGGVYRYRYPLDPERLSARPIERVTIAVTLTMTTPLTTAYSPSHELNLERPDAWNAKGVYQASDVLPTTDFLLYYAASSDPIGLTLLTERAPGDDGFFLLVAAPSDASASETALPKDLVLVLDRSGSMSGEKIDQAKSALSFILRNLDAEDRFAVLWFSDFIEGAQSGLVPASPTAIAGALAAVAPIDATGGTNIDAVLRRAFAMFEPGDRPRFLIFLTDGEPTVGEQDPARIAARALAANETAARLFAFGVGYNVNTVLLDQLAQENRGTTTYVLPGENLEIALSSFYRKIASPVLSEPALSIGGIGVFDVYPRILPDVFRGSQLLVLGKYRGDGVGRVVLTGLAEAGAAEYVLVQEFPAASAGASFLPRLWAGRKIAHLLDQIRLYGESDELVNEVIALSKQYGVITPYTSFLIDDGDISADEAADAVYRAAAPASGASAVQASSALKSLAGAETVQPADGRLQIVEGRAYYLRDGMWVDSGYAGEETIDVVPYSAAYFDLLDVVPWIGPHLAVGEAVIVRVGTVFVRIAVGGYEELPADVRVRLVDALQEG